MRLSNLFSSYKRKIVLGTGALLLALSFGAVGVAVQHVAASGNDCDNNAIIECGTGSASTFIGKVKSNNDGYGHHDLQAIYAYYGLESSSYDKFVTSAEPGTAYKDGRIVVDGQTVATNAASIGRQASYQGSGYFSRTIGGHTYYGNSNGKAFASDSLPVMVLFNAQGQMQFAVIDACGNPTYGTNVKPTYACTLLHKSAVSGQANTYSFTTSASAGNNASIAKLVYNFGDGTTATTTNPATAVQHTFSKAGSYKVTVTVYVHLPGNQTVTVTSAQCATTISVVAPYYSCVQLTGAILDQSKYSYSFQANASFGNGATFTGADFNFGDGNSTKGVKPTGTTASTTHQYAQAGNYQIVATLYFSVPGSSGVQSVNCSASVTPTQPPTPECKPGVPQGSPLCTPCQYNSSIPASDTEHCVAPVSTLVNTGPGSLVAIFSGVVVAGFVLFRQFIYRKRVVAADTTAAALGHHMLAGAARDEDSTDLVQQVSQGTHRTTNAAGNVHQTRYHRSNRFRPGKNE